MRDLSVTGVTFDGRDRVLLHMWNEGGAFQTARLRAEPGNKFDSNAVAVDIEEDEWVQVGYLPKYSAKQVQRYLLDKGPVLIAATLRGGGDGPVGVGLHMGDISTAFNIDVAVIDAWEGDHQGKHKKQRPPPRQVDTYDADEEAYRDFKNRELPT